MKVIVISLLLTLHFYKGISQIIPNPNSIVLSSNAKFELKNNFSVYYANETIKNEIHFLSDNISKNTGLSLGLSIDMSKLPMIKIKPNCIYIYLNSSISREGYELKIDSSTISISANNSIGVFYGIQSLIQLLPYKKTSARAGTDGDSKIFLPQLVIKDEPRFEWRGMHLDVCRHFFPKDFIKKYIDFLAMYKMNVFHWHLTEDQGWRIAIEKYPKLTEIGSVRNGSMVGPYNDHRIDSVRYGGYYSQEEIKDIVVYANERHITIVPEIEMPGHSLAALTAYPELSCTGGPFEVAKEWGVFDDAYCAGNEKTFEFLETVLNEVCELFPGKYIHIGGDECPKTRWEKCEKCQKRIKDNNLKDEHELQSYFIQRIEKYLNSKGKQIIGWDEILEGGLAPNAAVMSWRGTEGGIAAAKQKHKVVMTPGSHCYFDHYQGNPHNEPHAIGGYTTVEKVYSYDPIPTELNEEEKTFIMGAQGNVWTEYINSTSQVEYMAIPRMCALAEVLWTNKENKNEKEFLSRLSKHINILDSKKVNYATSFLQPTIETQKAKKGVELIVKKPNIEGKLKYSILKKMRYTDLKLKDAIDDETKLVITKSCGIFAYFSLNDSISSHSKWNQANIWVSKATSKKITFNTAPDAPYNSSPDFTLVNGIKASLPRVNSEWLAWSGKDVEILIDLESKQKISILTLNYLVDNNNWIYENNGIEILTSKDGIEFTPLKKPEPVDKEKDVLAKINRQQKCYIENYTIGFKKTKSRFIKIKIKNSGEIPVGRPGEGKPSWMFFDEIMIH